jgi:hypothetical protein
LRGQDTRWCDRLRRDCPEAARRLERGEFKSVQAALRWAAGQEPHPPRAKWVLDDVREGLLNPSLVSVQQPLEFRYIVLASPEGTAKQSNIDNDQTPQPPTLSEAETADVESYLADMLSIFPLVGLGVFVKTETAKKPSELLVIESKGIKASGYEDAKGFVVVRGSQLSKQETDTFPEGHKSLRSDLLTQGVIADRGANEPAFHASNKCC